MPNLIRPKSQAKTATLAKEFVAIRNLGYAIGVGFSGDITAIAFPVRCPDGLIASISIDGPSFQFDPKEGSSQVADWLEVVLDLENTMRRNHSQMINPFRQLDPRRFKLAL